MGRRRRAWHLSAAVLAGALVVGACGSSNSSASAGGGGSTTTAAAGPESTETVPATTAGNPATSGGTVSGPGVTASTITLGQISSISGPVPGLFEEANFALDAYVAYVNSKGGIDGHKLAVIHKDDAYSCNNYTNALRQLAGQVFAVVGTFSAQDGCGQSVLKANPTLPDVEGDILNPELFATPNAFAPNPTPPGYYTTGYQWVKDHYPQDITHAAALYSSESSFSFKEESQTAESLGFKYVYSRGLGLYETNFTSDVLRMKAEGVKVVDLTATAVTTMGEFQQAATQQNFHPDVVLSGTAYDAHLFKLLGGNTSDNIIAPLPMAMYLGQDRASNPELNTYLTWLAKTHPTAKADLFGTYAWAGADLFGQAVKDAGPTLTRASLLKALNGITSFNANGLLPTANPAKRQGAHCVVVIGVKNGAFVRLDPPTKGFECKGTYNNIPVSKLTG